MFCFNKTLWLVSLFELRPGQVGIYGRTGTLRRMLDAGVTH